MILPTLSRIFDAEQVRQKACITPAKYSDELDYTIRILQAHQARVNSYIEDLEHRESRFNRSFLDLMEDIPAAGAH
jgi:hypothetical protein